MSLDEFDTLAWKAVFGETTPEEAVLLDEVCRADEGLRARLARFRSLDATLAEAMAARRDVNASAGASSIPPARLEALMQAVPRPARRGAAIPRRRAVWWAGLGLTVAAAAAVVVMLRPARLPTIEDPTRPNRVLSPLDPGIAVSPESADPSSDYLPNGLTHMGDPILFWPGSAGDGETVRISVAGVGEIADATSPHPPVYLSDILAPFGSAPTPGMTYRVVLERAGETVREWEFTVSPHPIEWPVDVSESWLLESARRHIATAPQDAWQYYLRLGPAMRESRDGRAVLEALRGTAVPKDAR